MENLHLIQKPPMVYFSTVGKSQVVNFFCPQEDCGYFHNAITVWKNSSCPQPECYGHKKLATMRVVKDILKPSFGRPFFVRRRKICAHFGNGVMWLNQITVMVYLVQGEKLTKTVLTKVGCFTHVRMGKKIRVAISNGKMKRKTKIILNHWPLSISAIHHFMR